MNLLNIILIIATIAFPPAFPLLFLTSEER